ncbi:MAG: ECF transporter S component [Erysipelotrichia bacterium]|nr:ECF transporter S component [Erysipelotrichia bacterium]
MLKKVFYALILMLAIFIVGYSVNYNMGNLGYISLAGAFIMLFSRYFAPSYAMLIAAIPCVICDFLLGAKQYVLYTFILRAAEGYFLSHFLSKKKNFAATTFLVSLIMTLLAVCVDIYLYGITVLSVSLIKNIVQMLLVFVFANVSNYFLDKIRKKV